LICIIRFHDFNFSNWWCPFELFKERERVWDKWRSVLSL
jgi:hypothetical protein